MAIHGTSSVSKLHIQEDTIRGHQLHNSVNPIHTSNVHNVFKWNIKLIDNLIRKDWIMSIQVNYIIVLINFTLGNSGFIQHIRYIYT